VALTDSGHLSQPGPYAANMDCSWSLSCSDMVSRPQVTFSTFDTESNFDFVEFHSTVPADASNWDDRFHGASIPGPAVSTDSIATVRFVSDGSMGGNGFEADFTCVLPPPPPPPSACTTGIVVTNAGTVTQGPYQVNMDCSWTLVCTDFNLSPELTFNSFATEGGWDYVNVYFGIGGSSLGVPDVALSGTTLPNVQTGFGTGAVVNFLSDGSVDSNGFSFDFQCVDSGPAPPPPDCVGHQLLLDWSGGFHASGHATFGANAVHSPSFDNIEIAMANPRLGCTAFTNDVTGKMALILRGTCYFTTKALNAQNAGAVAAIIYNNQAGMVTMGGDDNSVTIPAIFIDNIHGEQLNSAIVAGNTTTVSMHCGTQSVNGAPTPPPDPCSGTGLELVDSGVVSKIAYGGNEDCTWRLECSIPTYSPLLTFSAFATGK